MPINNRISFRKGTSSEWSTSNPVLSSGEPGYDLTNNILKIGDGTSNWNSLNSISGSGLSSVTNISSGSGISVTSTSGNFTINALENIINSSNLYLWANFR